MKVPAGPAGTGPGRGIGRAGTHPAGPAGTRPPTQKSVEFLIDDEGDDDQDHDTDSD